jgi:predicted peptidase
MQKKILIFFIFCVLSFSLSAQNLSLYEKKKFVIENDTMPYRILLPVNFNPSKKYPLIIVLHGSGERGNDNEMQLVHGASLFLNEEIRKKYPAIIVFPQCSEKSYWSNVKTDTSHEGKRMFTFLEDGKPTRAMQTLQKLVQKIMHVYPVSKNRVYIGGLSMGGMGTFEIVMRNPKMFAAAFPICGGANPSVAKKIKNTDWWIFHGAQDNVVDPEYSISMFEALKKQQAKVKLTIYPEANHNSWDSAFAEKDLLPWLFARHK